MDTSKGWLHLGNSLCHFQDWEGWLVWKHRCLWRGRLIQPFEEEKEELDTGRGIIRTIPDNLNFVKLFCFNDSVHGTEGNNSNVGEDVPYPDTDP